MLSKLETISPSFHLPRYVNLGKQNLEAALHLNMPEFCKFGI